MAHRAWYQRHRGTIEDEAVAIRSFVTQLAALRNPYALAMVCTEGLDLDRADYVAAYEARDVHPEWVRAVDLTRWMIAGCSRDARQSVDDVMPMVDAALAHVEVWVAAIAESQPDDPTQASGRPCC
jgi:hypothetical protein